MMEAVISGTIVGLALAYVALPARFRPGPKRLLVMFIVSVLVWLGIIIYKG